MFVDTGHVIALLDRTDVFHDAATRWARRFVGRPHVTTTAVLIECGDAFGVPGAWEPFRRFLLEIEASPRLRIIETGRSWFDRGVALRDSRPDKDWGLTDCISFEVMRSAGITHALSCDRHFIQAGFRALLLEHGH